MTFLRKDKEPTSSSPTFVPPMVDPGNGTTEPDSDEENKIASSNNSGLSMRNSQHNEQWRTHPISVFEAKYHGENPEDRKLPSKVRKFYKMQDKLIESLQSTVSLLGDDDEVVEGRNRAAQRQQRINDVLIKATFFLNLALLISKLVASILSHSLSVISSLMDSAVDLASGFTLWITSHQMQKSLPYSYPTGKDKHCVCVLKQLFCNKIEGVFIP
ncbi:unnamed protein product [Rodentolepis nana]|uniref:Metal tolerance protein 9 n=1 Tax=Rodentolepis nana TaxID=102285 RepID=A0A0R3TJY0_RODNA|nr:unnamed protein product [Rodentolepis nana]